MSQRLLHILLLLAAVTQIATAQDIPPKPAVEQLVWDYAGVLDQDQKRELEDSLQHFARTTSNQIVVMTVSSFGNYTKEEYGVELGRKWGVGQSDKNNGVIILVKPKTESERGEAYISTGYGAEGPLPDLLCAKIVENEMIPHFKENDYAGGIWAALKVVEPALQGDFNEEVYLNGDDGDWVMLIFVFLVIFAFVYFASKYGDNNGTGGGNNTRTYTGGGPIFFPTGRSSSWGGSSWGGSSGGGFGGFGGGSFGGGGGGGSW